MYKLRLPPLYSPLNYKNLNFSMPYHPFHSPHIFGTEPNPYKGFFTTKNNKKDNEIRDGDIVYFPQETYIPLSTVEKMKEEEKKRRGMEKSELLNLLDNKGNIERKIELDRLEKRAKLAYKNKRKWMVLKAGVHIIYLYKTIRLFTKSSIKLKKKKIDEIKIMSIDLIQIRGFLLPVLGNIEKFILNFFHYAIVYNTNDVDKQLNSTFIVKSFIHQIFSDFTAAFVDDEAIPYRIKDIFKKYINDKSKLPFGFLTSFEFNRLEFDNEIRLTKMTNERKGLMVCFLMFYRVFICDILKNPYTYFKRLHSLKPSKQKLQKVLQRRLDMIKQRREIGPYLSPSPIKKSYGAKGEPKDEHYYQNKYNTFFGGSAKNHDSSREKSKSSGVEKRVTFMDDEEQANNDTEKERERKGKRNNLKIKTENKLNSREFDVNKRFNPNTRKYQTTNIPPACPPKSNEIRDTPQKTNSNFYNDQLFSSRNSTNRIFSRTKSQDSQNFKTMNTKQSERKNSRKEKIIRPVSSKEKTFYSPERTIKTRQEIPLEKMVSSQKIIIEKEEIQKLQIKVKHNFNFIINVLHYIFKSTFEENIPIYHDSFKETYIYRSMVYKGKKYNTTVDDIELVKGIVKDQTKTDSFIRTNERWLQMYKFTAFQLCIDFAKKCNM